jgi:hypothetical protein
MAAAPKQLTFADLKTSLKDLGATPLFPDLFKQLSVPLQAVAIALQTQNFIKPAQLSRQERNRSSDFHVTGTYLTTELEVKMESIAVQVAGEILSKGWTSIEGLPNYFIEMMARQDPAFPATFFDEIRDCGAGETPDMVIFEVPRKVKYKTLRYGRLPENIVRLNSQQLARYQAAVTRLIELDVQEISEVANDQARSVALAKQHAFSSITARGYYIHTLWTILHELYPLKNESPASTQ